jgi:hypothetical protein
VLGCATRCTCATDFGCRCQLHSDLEQMHEQVSICQLCQELERSNLIHLGRHAAAFCTETFTCNAQDRSQLLCGDTISIWL